MSPGNRMDVLKNYTDWKTIFVKLKDSMHSIIQHWTPDCAEFKEVVKCRSTTTQLKLKWKMEVLARERVFYINTITHHAGI